jgi:hypothetical protein
MKRDRRTPNSKPSRAKGEARVAWPAEVHTGEGAASALETLQTQQRRRRYEAGQAEAPQRNPRGGTG